MSVPHRLSLLGMTAVVLASGALGVGVAEALDGGSHHQATPAGRYGALPAYLPKDTLQTDATVSSSVARPAITSQGDAIRATLPSGAAVTVRITGPKTPGEGLPFQASADTATWTVDLSNATGRIPVSRKAFSAIDSLGKVYQLTYVPGAHRPPAVMRPGQTVRFQLRVVMRVGEGDMRWAPVDNDLIGTWDFVVEND